MGYNNNNFSRSPCPWELKQQSENPTNLIKVIFPNVCRVCGRSEQLKLRPCQITCKQEITLSYCPQFAWFKSKKCYFYSSHFTCGRLEVLGREGDDRSRQNALQASVHVYGLSLLCYFN